MLQDFLSISIYASERLPSRNWFWLLLQLLRQLPGLAETENLFLSLLRMSPLSLIFHGTSVSARP